MFSESAFHHPRVLHSRGLHRVAKSAETEWGWPALWVTSQGTRAALGPSPWKHVCSKALAEVFLLRHSPARGLGPLRRVSPELSLRSSPAPTPAVSVPGRRRSAGRQSPACVRALRPHSQKAATRRGAVPECRR